MVTLKSGARFLHERDDRLHTSRGVERAAARARAGRRPEEKIGEYLGDLERLFTRPARGSDLERFDLSRNTGILKRRLYDTVVIRPENIPETYFRQQAVKHGEADTPAWRRRMTEVVAKDQKTSLDLWVNHLTFDHSAHMPMWAKYWVFKGMVGLSAYDKTRHKFGRRTKDTVVPFPELNEEALNIAVNVMSKRLEGEALPYAVDTPKMRRLVDGGGFGGIYAHAIELVGRSHEGQMTTTEGRWVKYERGSELHTLLASIQGYDTGWCSAGEGTLRNQLSMGDFYIYYSNDENDRPSIPRAAIKMKGDRIDEVRGIAPHEHLDSHIIDLVGEKLVGFGDAARSYEPALADMKRLTEIELKQNVGGGLTRDELRFLYEIDGVMQCFGNLEDPRAAEIKSKRDLRADLCTATSYKDNEISVTRNEASKPGVRFHYGELRLMDVKRPENLTLPREVTGDLVLTKLESAKGLTLPERVGGKLILVGLKSSEGLTLPQSVGGNIIVRRGRIKPSDLTLPKDFKGELYLL